MENRVSTTKCTKIKYKRGMLKMSRKIPEFLEVEEQERLINIFNTRYITPQRNKTIVILLLNTGLRLSEMINLKYYHINLMTGRLKVVQGKGAKDRIIYINDDTLEVLKDWKERQFKEWGVSEYVFTTRTLKQLDGKAVRKMLRTYSKKAEIKKHVTTHTLRHTYATDLLRETSNIRLVQKALGHEDITTTEIYTHIVDAELEEALRNFRN